MKSDAVFDYEERYRRPPGAGRRLGGHVGRTLLPPGRKPQRLNRNEQTCRLRESVRETVVRREVLPEVIYAVDDYFRRDELELLRLPVSSVAIDQLLPVEAVRSDRTYTPSRDAMVSVLNLTSVEATDVTARSSRSPIRMSESSSAAKSTGRSKVCRRWSGRSES